MCGILVCFDKRVSEEQFLKAFDLIKHRGTRSSTMEIGKVKIGHHRLPLVGPSEENDYPIVVHDSLIWLVGEFYSYDERSYTSDAAHMLAIQHEIGYGVLPGMYHSAIYHKGTWRFSSDSLGKKPWYFRSDIPSISTEMKALVALGPLELDEQYFKAVATKDHMYLAQHTPWKKIIKLNPGRCLTYTTSLAVAQDPLLSSPLSAESLKDLLEEACFLRVPESREFGMYVSGGLDSSILYTMLKVYNPTVYHIDNGESEYLNMLNIPEDKIVPVAIPEEIDLDDILRTNESPLDYGSMVSQYYLAKATKEDVVITGDGADELFCGYNRCQVHDTSRRDMLELMYYHIPRIDKHLGRFTKEARHPFLHEWVFQRAQSTPWEQKKGKAQLKRVAREIGVPKAIIDRKKAPLKSPYVKEAEWQQQLISRFKELYDERK